MMFRLRTARIVHSYSVSIPANYLPVIFLLLPLYLVLSTLLLVSATWFIMNKRVTCPSFRGAAASPSNVEDNIYIPFVFGLPWHSTHLRPQVPNLFPSPQVVVHLVSPFPSELIKNRLDGLGVVFFSPTPMFPLYEAGIFPCQ